MICLNHNEYFKYPRFFFFFSCSCDSIGLFFFSFFILCICRALRRVLWILYTRYFGYAHSFCHLHSETLQLLTSTELELILCCMLWRALCSTVYYSSSLFTFDWQKKKNERDWQVGTLHTINDNDNDSSD